MPNSYNISKKNVLITALIFALSLLLGERSFAQEVDSKVKSQIIKSNSSWQNKDTTLALQYAEKAIELAFDANGLTRAVASNNMADLLRYNDKLGEAFDLYYSAYLLLQDVKIKDNKTAQLNTIKSLTGFGFLFYKMGAWQRTLNSLIRLPDSYSPTFGNDFAKIKRISIECYFKKEQYENAIKTCDELIANNIEIEYAYAMKSDCYIQLSQFNNAIENENKLILLYEQNEELFKVPSSKIRIAQWYALSNNEKVAIDTYISLLINNNITNLQRTEIKYLLAKCYSSIKEYTKAENLIRETANKIVDINNDIVIKSYKLWIMIPHYANKNKLAYQRLQIHKDEFDEIKNNRLLLSLYNSATIICEGVNKKSEAYNYFKKANELNIRILENEHAAVVDNYNLQLQVDLFSNKILNNRITYEFEKQIEETQNYKEGEQKAEQRNDQLLLSRQIMAFFILLGLIAFYIGYLNYKKRQKLLLEIKESHDLLSEKNKHIEQKSIELAQKNKETQEALEQIRNMQDQLIESQRLASLGQVTAGIAHEIRNPLNFVTNFSSLIVELLEDLQEIVEKNIKLPPSEELEEIEDIIKTINSNAQKINTHGNRASSIISNMLDVSRKNTNSYTYEAINQLIKDSAELAFEGAKGSMAGLNIDLKFHFDDNITNIPIIKQDLSRVFINLISNSCHAIEPKLNFDKNYIGKIDISTKLINNNVQINITDNGTGISKEVIENIFTPFFTTKDSGKGTGLGLTMSYDIITKLHKGSINVESAEGEYTTFIIEIPTNLKS